jgi:hypothetical protein
MSTKTIRKRIALVAVTALTAGLVSVVGTPAANAAVGGANATTAANTLQLATFASTTGSAVTTSVAEVVGTPTNGNRSVGLIYQGTGTGTTQTAVMLNTGALVLYTGVATTLGVFVADGGTFSGATSTGTDTVVSADRIKVSLATGGAVAFTPNAGVTSATVYFYSNTGTTLVNPSAGTLNGQITIAVTTADATGTYSSTYSKIQASNAAVSATATTVPSSNVDVQTSIVNGGTGYVGLTLKDAFGVTLGAGALIATATNNVQVGWGSVSSTSSTVAVKSDYSYGDLLVKQGSANLNKPVTTTISFTYNGVAVGSKTLTFWGTATKIDVYNVVTSNLSTANAIGDYVPAGANFKVYDAAGNWIQEPTAQAVVVDSTTLDSNVTAVTVARVSNPLDNNVVYFGDSGQLTWTCSTLASGKSAAIKVYTLNALNQKVYGSFNAACSGTPYTFKASTDKAVYAPGDIITVTLSGYDLAGNLANDRTEIGESVTTVKPVIASGGFASSTGVDTPASTDVATAGAWAYRFIVGNTEGTYAISAQLPSGSGQAAATLPITIKSTSTAISLADVLKAIVSLIASINKQIAALQKALLKK